MKPFRLHTVLSYRRTLENRAQERLVRAREEVDRVLREMELEQERLREMCQDFEDRKRQGMSVREVLVYQNHLRRVRNEIACREEELQSAREDMARREGELHRASRDRKLLEKLKEKQDARYLQYLEDKEKKELDEVAVLFHEKGGV
jgi:flagellar FliJ protein